MAFRLQHSVDAKRDMNKILVYLAEAFDAPNTARRFYDELHACYKRMRKFPYMYPACRDMELAAKGFRCAQVKRYIVFFTVLEETRVVRIHRILHGTMDYLNLPL